MNQQSTPPGPPTTDPTAVMVTMTVRQGKTFEDVKPFALAEVTETMKLYLDGKIRQMFSHADGRGAVFFVDAKTVEEAHAIIDSLPFSRENLMDHQFTPVGPLAFFKRLLPE